MNVVALLDPPGSTTVASVPTGDEAMTTDGSRNRYHPLRVTRRIEETDDAATFVLEVPRDLVAAFDYRAGQFLTVRVTVDGRPRWRSYSMSSAPSVDPDLQITVKRVPGGLVSNWLIDRLGEGDPIMASEPGGGFVLDETVGDIVAFAGGSGITPVHSIIKAALHGSDRRIRLLFANRDRRSAIFADELDELARQWPDRLQVIHHTDASAGFLTPAEVVAFIGDRVDTDVYVCGPDGFMAVVADGVAEAAVDPARVHVERFTPAVDPSPAAGAGPDDGTGTTITITIGRRTETVAQRAGATLLQSARFAGLHPPSSCVQGHCATCMARVVSGNVEMTRNDVLTDDEVADGWVLTCQAVPVSESVHVVYEP